MSRIRLNANRNESSFDKFLDATCMLGLGVVDFIVRITANDFREVQINAEAPRNPAIEEGSRLGSLENKTPMRQLDSQRRRLGLTYPRQSQRRKSASVKATVEKDFTELKQKREKFKEENRLEIRVKWLESLGVDRVALAFKNLSYMDSIQVLLLLNDDFVQQLANFDFLDEIMKTFEICRRENAIEELNETEKLLAIDALVLSCQNHGRLNTKNDAPTLEAIETPPEVPFSVIVPPPRTSPSLEELFVKQQAERVSAELERIRAKRKEAMVTVSEKVEFRGAPRKVKIKILN